MGPWGPTGTTVTGGFSDDPSTPSVNPDPATGFPQMYGNGNYTVLKEYSTIPLCNGKPIGISFNYTVALNPSNPKGTTIKGTVNILPQ